MLAEFPIVTADRVKNLAHINDSKKYIVTLIQRLERTLEMLIRVRMLNSRLPDRWFHGASPPAIIVQSKGVLAFGPEIRHHP